MSTASRLGKVRCQHRWTKPQYAPYPTVPSLAPDDDEQDYPDMQIEWGTCKRCGGARVRLYVSQHVCPGWSYAESLTELLLGRPLNDSELKHAQQSIVLN